MTVSDIRLKCLELTNPNNSSPDVDRWLQNARQLEAYVSKGQADEAPRKRRGRPPNQPKTDTPSGPANGTVPSLVT